nr:Ycf33 protein [Pyropia sp. Myanmar_A]BED43362.1 Ycf33 protein [Pyropia sp. Myanmar_B]BED43559.1 Ycf33 protein [Pyropia sp. Myanmar_C]
MSKFWDNILKFPRFLISVILGLILIIIRPFFVLFKKPVTNFFFLISLTGLIGILTITIKKMLNIECC